MKKEDEVLRLLSGKCLSEDRGRKEAHMSKSSLMDVIIDAAERSEKRPLYRASDATRAELQMLEPVRDRAPEATAINAIEER